MRNILNKLKDWAVKAIEYAISTASFVENNFAGKSGAEKKQLAIEMLINVITIPFVPKWVMKWVLGWVVDKAVVKLNEATSGNFTGLSLSPSAVHNMAVTSNTKELATEIPWHERYQQLIAKYTNDGDKDAAYEIIEMEEPPAIESNDELFDRCLAFVKLAEGGKNFNVVNGKPILKPGVYDTGGPTAYGITQGTLKEAYASGIVSHADITRLTREEAVMIYRRNYWDKYVWDGLPYPICLIAFDTVVNVGLGYVCQDALNTMGEFLVKDGLYGKKTKEALFRLANINTAPREKLAYEMLVSRLEWFEICIQKKPKNISNRNGWRNRVKNLAKECGVKSPA